MPSTLLHGRFLTFNDRPEAIDDTASYRYENDGGIWVEDGLIRQAGTWDAVRAAAPSDAIEIDHRPHLIMPGFVDPHIHFPQMQVIGSYAANLLEWLNTYTFVEEQRFADPDHAARVATHFFDELIRHGTTTAAAYCSVHKASADAFFAEATLRNLRMVAGKVMMDRNAPGPLTDTPQAAYDDTKAVIADWHGTGRNHVAITPRFAITSSPAELELAGALTAEHPELHVQTHLAENHGEIAFTRELYPEAIDYTDVYARSGLLGPKSLLGHCIHLSDREAGVLAESGSVAVFCPTSNLFLGSGLFDNARLAGHGVRTAIATDVGGGTNYSMLRTLDEGYKVLQLQGQRMTPLDAFYRITLGNARALSLAEHIGTLEPGSDADLVVLDASAMPAMAIKAERVETLVEELFLLQTLGDDRAIAEVYVAGEAVKSGL
ncbi:guanine deaminase [Pararhizobium mangrovi]|uniref:Guanine deaminase n=1 Tax=Pararhizobium mangrovi TaxID=2590452 RepID=A0A506TX30_9HYPH|nr:guanine deaminase [Pararhizobium mangrovi]TPW26623.1 guanine deaminase [Pararhizobium mangrovi]